MIVPDIFQNIDIPPHSVKISEQAILNWLGYEKDQTDPFVLEMIRDCIQRTNNLIIPKGVVIIKPLLSIHDGVIQLPETELHVGKIITGQLKHAEYLAIFITTIGNRVERFSDQLFKQGEMLEGYIINLIGSEAAESAAEYIHQIIAEQIKPKGLNITNRFSPGYCNWDVAEQFYLFSQFPTSFSDVSLTSSALMEPVKSVSGIVGIGANVKFHNYKCSLCTDDKCIYRNRKRS
jgi:hypothetical protein